MPASGSDVFPKGFIHGFKVEGFKDLLYGLSSHSTLKILPVRVSHEVPGVYIVYEILLLEVLKEVEDFIFLIRFFLEALLKILYFRFAALLYSFPSLLLLAFSDVHLFNFFKIVFEFLFLLCDLFEHMLFSLGLMAFQLPFQIGKIFFPLLIVHERDDVGSKVNHLVQITSGDI